MHIEKNNKQIKIKYCVNFFSRLKGFMGKKNISYGIIFPRCNSIHTCFMKEAIDVLMCDKDYKILYIYTNLKKNKFILPKKRVYYTIELPVNFFTYSIGENVFIKK